MSAKFELLIQVSVVAAGAAAAVAFFDPLGFRAPTLVSVCEEAIKDRLKSPSGYKRISVTDETSRKATLDEVMGWAPGTDDRTNDLYDALNTSPQLPFLRLKMASFERGQWLHSAMVEYDAPNGFGVPIRSYAECSILSGIEDDYSKPASYNVMVDGQTNTDWMASQLRANGEKASLTPAQEKFALGLLEPVPEVKLTDDECTWLKAAWAERRYSEAIDKYGSGTGNLLDQCK